jgi:adenine/guanine phosphoribosyltransferase-like PRPP-binding protein
MAIELKKQNPKLFYWDNKKIHIGSLQNDNVQQAVTDTLIDFFIMTKCDKMFCYAFNGISGFSKLISLIYNKEFIEI